MTRKPRTEKQKERAKERNKVWRAAHPEEVKAQDKAYYEAHSEEVKARHKAHREEDNARSRAWRAAHGKENNARSRAWRAAHPEKMRAQNKAYREAHREEDNARSRAWRAAHSEESRVRDRIWHAAHPEQRKAWRAAHPEAVKLHSAKRREMGYKPLNWWFSGCNAHHICDPYVIHIPKELHVAYLGHNHYKPETMIKINKAAWMFLESQNGGRPWILPEMQADLEILKLKTTDVKAASRLMNHGS